jgi:uncharacterized protein with HEPN domain
MLSDADVIRLRHMLDAAKEAVAFLKDRDHAELTKNRMLSFAIVRAIEIIGEAASKVSPEGRAICASIPWPSIIGMRNRIVHAYFDVDLDRVWDTVKIDLPELILKLESFL